MSEGLFSDAVKCSLTLPVVTEKKKVAVMCLRPSTSLIYSCVTGIKITLGDIMKFHLSHQLMQHKSIFVQTGRATYITVMTMQSRGELLMSLNVITIHLSIWKQSETSSKTLPGSKEEAESFPCHRSALQLAFLPLFGLAGQPLHCDYH